MVIRLFAIRAAIESFRRRTASSLSVFIRRVASKVEPQG